MPFIYRTINSFFLLCLAALAILGAATGCRGSASPDPTSPSTTPTKAVSPSPTLVPTVTSTPTPPPPKELTVCQAKEPNTLFIYGGPSRAARNVLDAVYDGPLDTREYAFEPVILERLPSVDEGEVVVKTVTVSEGERVLSMQGKVVELRPDVKVSNAEGDRVTFDGRVVTMTQMVVTFTLRSDVTWSDGEPLTAEDSRFSYELVEQLEDAALRRRADRTASYEARDAHTLVWTSVPGYYDGYYLLNLYHPLPRHVLGDTTLEHLLEAEVVHERPLTWGPFAVEAWERGDHITLVRNPHYFRASEGLPHLDRLIFRFIEDPRQAIEELFSGECDIVSEDLLAGAATSTLADISEVDDVHAVSEASGEWEHLDFGIQPAAWSQRVTFFDNREVRQAIAHCVDRERIANEAFPFGDAVVADSYVLPQHPLHGGDALHRWAYDPASGRTMLSEAGWRDVSGDGIREAEGAPGVASGTALSVTLLTTQGDPARARAAEVLQENLADCGVGLSVEYLPPDAFYADGPDGPVFGREFELALFSWLNGLSAPCDLYLSTQIPSEDNWWATSNNPGYSSDAYDAACRSALDALYGTERHSSRHREAQHIFSEDLPVLPLYFVPRMIAVRHEVEGVVLDPSRQTITWNAELLDVKR